jgi:hypothetical protein
MVRIGSTGQRRAVGPIHTVEQLKGLSQGILWAKPTAKFYGLVDAVPADCVGVTLADDPDFTDVEPPTFEDRLVAVLFYNYREGRWDPEKEWNADRWQDVGLLLDDFGIECPGEDAPHPVDAEEE